MKVVKGMKSKFTGSTFGFIGIYFVAVLLMACTLGIGSPWAMCMVMRWTTSHTIIDGKQLKFDGTGGRFFGAALLWSIPAFVIAGLGVYITYYVQDIAMVWLLTAICLLLFFFYVFWLAIREMKWFTKHTHFVTNEVEEKKEDNVMDFME